MLACLMPSPRHLIAATVLVLAMTACSAPDEEIADTRPSPSPSASATDTGFDVEVRSFLDAKHQSPDLVNVSDDTALTAGRATCAALDRGQTVEDVYAAALQTSGRGGVVIFAFASTTLCRDHMEDVQAFAEATGL